MAAILLRLEMVSHGSTQAWNASGGHSGEPDDRMVALIAGRVSFPHLAWRDEYEGQSSVLGREEVIAGATRDLEAWTKRTLPQVEGKSLAAIIVEDGEGFDAQIVAQRFNVDAALVRRFRMRANRGTEDGREVVPSGSEDRPSRAREFRRAGLSTRQIAAILGCHQTQVMRWVRDRAVSAW